MVGISARARTHTQAEVEIHEDAAGTVIGKGGANIARLQVFA